MHDAAAGTTEALTCDTHILTLLSGQKYMFHGYCGGKGYFDFVMEWEQETDTEGGVIMGVEGTNANLSASGDSIAFRAPGDGVIELSLTAPAEGTSVPMAVVANVASDTLSLPYSGEESDVSIPTGKTHTIALNGDDTGMGMLILQMDGNDDGGGGDDEPCPGDANQDGVVDVNDLLEVIAQFGAACP